MTPAAAARAVRTPGGVFVPPFRLSYGGARFALFSRDFGVHTKGKWSGKPVEFEPWQLLDIASPLFERERDVFWTVPERAIRRGRLTVTEWRALAKWVEGVDPGSSLRIVREALVGLPRKNGKSLLAALVALYLLVADDEPGAEVYSAAADKKQAAIVFNQAKRIVELSPTLSRFVEIYRDSLVVPSLDAIYRVLSADAKLQEGLNPHGLVIDEIHAHPDLALYDTLLTAISEARDQPLALAITTAGPELRTNPAGELFVALAGARPKIRHGRVEPLKTKSKENFFYWTTVADADRFDPAGWKLANPASWVSIPWLLAQSRKPRPYAVFERYRLNRWVRVEGYLFPPGRWRGLIVDEPDLERGDGVIVTWDLGQFRDSTAVAVVRPGVREVLRRGKTKRVGKHRVYGWVAALHKDPRDPPPLAHRIVEGDGPIRIELLRNRVLALAKAYRILAVGGDPFKTEDLLEEFESMGFAGHVIRFDQTNSRMVPASERLYVDVMESYLEVPDDPVLEAQIEAAVARDVGGGRWRLDKSKALEPMDFAQALAMGVSLAENPEVVRSGRPSARRVA